MSKANDKTQMTTVARRTDKKKKRRLDWLRCHTIDAHVSLPAAVERLGPFLASICFFPGPRPAQLSSIAHVPPAALAALWLALPIVVRFPFYLCVAQHVIVARQSLPLLSFWQTAEVLLKVR